MVHEAEPEIDAGQTRAIVGQRRAEERQVDGLRALSRADLNQGDLTGYQLGNYALGRRLGQGGMGQVFVARHLTLERACALKFICPEAQGSEEAISRFMMEIKALGALESPHIVHALDAGCIDGLHYYVTELLDGHDLAGWVAERGTAPLAAACEIIRQAAIGLAHAHHHRFVHRDIKPANLFLTNQGVVKVLDFGLARNALASSELTGTQHLLGTVDYFAPEQAENPQHSTKSSDIYSLGLTLVYLLSGQAPYPADRYPTIVSKLRGHMVDRPAWLIDNAHRLPAEVQKIIDLMIAKPTVDRFGHCGQVAEAVRQWANSDELCAWQLGLTLSEARTAKGHQGRSLSRQRLINRSSLAAGGLLVAVGGFTWQMQPWSTSTRHSPSSLTQATPELAQSPAHHDLALPASTTPAPQSPRSQDDTDGMVTLPNQKPSASARALRLQAKSMPRAETGAYDPIGANELAPIGKGINDKDQ